LLIAAVLVVLARVGLWRQTFVSDRAIRLLAPLASYLIARCRSQAFGKVAFRYEH
jgi:hypothetical protein